MKQGTESHVIINQIRKELGKRHLSRGWSLFRVMRAGVDENIVVQYEASSHSMPADLVKGVVLVALAGATPNGCQWYLLRK